MENKDFDSSIDKDTLYQIPSWSFENQNSQIIAPEQLDNKIKLVDFFLQVVQQFVLK